MENRLSLGPSPYGLAAELLGENVENDRSQTGSRTFGALRF